MEGAYVYANPRKPLRLYRMVMIDPVEVRVPDGGANSAIDQESLSRVARTLERELRAALGNSYPVVDEPGWQVLRIRAAITDVRAANPALNSVPGVRLAGHGFGGAGIEAEFVDTQTKEQVAAFVDTCSGKAHRRLTGTTETGHAEDCLRDWAGLLKDTLDGTQGLHPNAAFRTSGDRWR
jgi:hypothetical protein